jgi:copper chaperone CopZ
MCRYPYPPFSLLSQRRQLHCGNLTLNVFVMQITVMLRVAMHCEACVDTVRRAVVRMPGIYSPPISSSCMLVECAAEQSSKYTKQNLS